MKKIFRNLSTRSCKISFCLLISLACSFKKVKLELLTDIDLLLIVEKGNRGGIYYSINRYRKANHKYMRDYDKNKESSSFKCI